MEEGEHEYERWKCRVGALIEDIAGSLMEGAAQVHLQAVRRLCYNLSENISRSSVKI